MAGTAGLAGKKAFVLYNAHIVFIALLLAMVASIALPAVIEDSPPPDPQPVSQPDPPTTAEPLIAVVDTGVRRSLYETEEGSVFANDDLALPASVNITLGGAASVTVTLDDSFGDNGLLDPADVKRDPVSRDAGTHLFCYRYNPSIIDEELPNPSCPGVGISVRVDAGAPFSLTVPFETKGEMNVGALQHLRPEARLLIRQMHLNDEYPWRDPAMGDLPLKETFDQLRAYNSWARGAGAELVRVVSNSYVDVYDTVSVVLTTGVTVTTIDPADIRRPSYAESVGDFLIENPDALAVFTVGLPLDFFRPPAAFPDAPGLIPYWLTGKGGGDDVSLCLYLNDPPSSCPNTHDFNYEPAPGSADYSEVPNRFIAVANAFNFFPSTGGDDRASFHHDNRCGFAKEWCLTATSLFVPVQAPPGGFPRVVEVTSPEPATITVFAMGGITITASGVGGVTLTTYWYQDLNSRFTNLALGSSRVAAAAAGVMKELDEAGMTDAQMVQAVLFKTAYKCWRTVGNRRENEMAADPITSMVRADMLPSSVTCPDGFNNLGDDTAGQGHLNYDGAIEEAESIKVRSRDGVLSEFKSTAFNAPEAFGRGAAKRLAEADLELVATATGNTYRHRPPAAGLRPATSAYGDDQRIALFGAQRAPPESAGFGLFQHRPAAWAAPEDALASGFTWRSRFAEGAFQFSYDLDLLPSRFMAAATLQPEARSSPYLDFVRTGTEASYTRGPLSLAVAQGGRVDELGETEALVALGGYRHALGENAVLHMGLGVLQEDDRLLGAGTGGAFAIEDAHTRFARFGVEWRLGKATLFATHWRGETSAPAGETSVFDGPVRVRTASYAAGALGEDVLASGDELTFTVYQPLRVYGGRMELSLPKDRNGDEQDGAVVLGADGREIGLGLGYRRPLPNGGHWSFGLLHRTDPDHRRGAASESVAAVAVGYDW